MHGLGIVPSVPDSSKESRSNRKSDPRVWERLPDAPDLVSNERGGSCRDGSGGERREGGRSGRREG